MRGYGETLTPLRRRIEFHLGKKVFFTNRFVPRTLSKDECAHFLEARLKNHNGKRWTHAAGSLNRCRGFCPSRQQLTHWFDYLTPIVMEAELLAGLLSVPLKVT